MGILESDQSGFISQLFQACFSRLTGCVVKSKWELLEQGEFSAFLPSLHLQCNFKCALKTFFFEFLMKERPFPDNNNEKKKRVKGNNKWYIFKKCIYIQNALNSKQGVAFSVWTLAYITLWKEEAIKWNVARAASVTLWESINLSLFSLIQIGLSDHLLQKGSEGLWRSCCINQEGAMPYEPCPRGFPLQVLIKNEIKNSLRLYQPFKGIRRSMIC